MIRELGECRELFVVVNISSSGNLDIKKTALQTWIYCGWSDMNMFERLWQFC